MNLNEAIKHAEMMAPKNEGVLPGSAGYSYLVYYVCRWNDGYCVNPNSYIQRHPNVKWIYNTKDKVIIGYGNH